MSSGQTAVVLGDSVSHHVGVGNAGLGRVTWAQRVADASNFDLTVAALSGASTIEAETRLLPSVTGRYNLALCFLGINDVKQVRIWDGAGFHARLTRCLAHLSERADRTLVLTLPPNLGALPTLWPYGPRMRRRVHEANQIIESMPGVEVVRLPALRLRSELWADGLHPTSLGHLRMAKVVAAAVGLPAPAAEPEPLTPEYVRWWRHTLANQIVTRPPRAAIREVQALLD